MPARWHREPAVASDPEGNKHAFEGNRFALHAAAAVNQIISGQHADKRTARLLGCSLRTAKYLRAGKHWTAERLARASIALRQFDEIFLGRFQPSEQINQFSRGRGGEMAKRGNDGDAGVPAGNGASKSKLHGLVRRIEAKKAVLDNGRSDLGNIYQEAEEQGFNGRALKEAIRLKNMEPAKRHDYLTSLNAYCDELGMFAQGDLLNEEPRPPQAETTEQQQPEPTRAEQAERNEQASETARGYTVEVGRLSALDGKTADDNPWPLGTKAHDSWNSGWELGRSQKHGEPLPMPAATGRTRGKRSGRGKTSAERKGRRDEASLH
jgi:uncharacterized protein (UPF0335 family)